MKNFVKKIAIIGSFIMAATLSSCTKEEEMGVTYFEYKNSTNEVLTIDAYKTLMGLVTWEGNYTLMPGEVFSEKYNDFGVNTGNVWLIHNVDTVKFTFGETYELVYSKEQGDLGSLFNLANYRNYAQGSSSETFVYEITNVHLARAKSATQASK